MKNAFSITQEYFGSKVEKDIEETDMGGGDNVDKMPTIWEDAISWSNFVLDLAAAHEGCRSGCINICSTLMREGQVVSIWGFISTEAATGSLDFKAILTKNEVNATTVFRYLPYLSSVDMLLRFNV